MENLIQSPLFPARCLILIVGLALSLSRKGKAQKIITGRVVLSPPVLFLSLLAGSFLTSLSGRSFIFIRDSRLNA